MQPVVQHVHGNYAEHQAISAFHRDESKHGNDGVYDAQDLEREAWAETGIDTKQQENAAYDVKQIVHVVDDEETGGADDRVGYVAEHTDDEQYHPKYKRCVSGVQFHNAPPPWAAPCEPDLRWRTRASLWTTRVRRTGD